MRHAIETAPRDGQAVILENDSAGTYDVAHWSDQVGQWVAENGEPSKVTPTHWHPIPKYFQQEHDESSTSSQLGRPSPRPWRLVTVSTVALIAAALICVYFYFGFGRETLLPSEASRKTESLALRQQPEADQSTARAGTQQAVQAKQAVEASEPPKRQSLENEPPREVLANELSETRRAIEGIDVQLRAEAANRARSLEQEQQKTTAIAQQAAAERQELTTSTEKYRQALDEERARSAALASELATAQRENEVQAAQLRKANEEAGQLRQAEAANSAQMLDQERQKTAALALQAAAARQELTTSTQKHRQALDEERARHATLWSELAAAQRENEAQAQLRKASEEAGQLKQAETANSAQSLEQARQETAALAQQAAAARQELTTSTAKHRQALDEERASSAALKSELATAQRENELQAAQLRKASEEAGQLKQATERTVTDLRQSLQQERDRTEAMARDIEAARRAIDVRATSEPAVTGIAKAAQVIEVAAMAQPAAVEAQGSPEAARLIARARALLGQGNIGAARIVLERAAETGSARASFTLAETYDPAILSTWGTYGTRGDTAKARELYAKAHAGGIHDAKDRLERLDQ